MKLSEFASIINNTLQDSLGNPGFDNIYHFESALSALTISQALSNVAKNPDEMNRQNMTGFVNLLKNRWEVIRATDAMEQYCTDSVANNACRAMAQRIIDSQAGPSSRSTKSEILFPGFVKNIETASNRINVFDARPQSFVLTDDGKDAINIYKCLKEINTESFTKGLEPQLHTTNSKENRPLSEDERRRVIEHCDATREYYVATSQAIKEGNLTSDMHSALKTALNDGLKKPEITYSYGEEGQKRLVERLYAGITHFNQLVSALNTMPQNYWQSFIKFMPKEKRAALLAGINKESVSTYGALPQKETRTAYCAMYYLYEQDRLTKSYVKKLDTTEKPFFSDISGNVQHYSAKFAGLLFPNRESKTSAAEVVIDMLQDEQVSLFDAAYVLSVKGRLPKTLEFDDVVVQHAKAIEEHTGDIFNKKFGELTKVLVGQFEESIKEKNEQAKANNDRPDMKKAS